MEKRPLRWLLVQLSGCVLALGSVGSVSSLVSNAAAQAGQAKPVQARRDLDDARARWRTNTIPHYRVRVTTGNSLLVTVTESDVRNGSVVVARGASAMPGLGDRPGSGNWGPADGQTVEALFQLIEDALQTPGEVVSATYDARRGYPTQIGMGPASMTVIDADVLFTIELIESPAVPLVAPSPGEAYRSPAPARLVDLIPVRS